MSRGIQCCVRCHWDITPRAPQPHKRTAIAARSSSAAVFRATRVHRYRRAPRVGRGGSGDTTPAGLAGGWLQRRWAAPAQVVDGRGTGRVPLRRDARAQRACGRRRQKSTGPVPADGSSEKARRGQTSQRPPLGERRRTRAPLPSARPDGTPCFALASLPHLPRESPTPPRPRPPTPGPTAMAPSRAVTRPTRSPRRRALHAWRRAAGAAPKRGGEGAALGGPYGSTGACSRASATCGRARRRTAVWRGAPHAMPLR